MPGAIAGAMMFFLLLAAAVIVGAYVFAYTAHVFLVVIEGTATGFDEVTWPDEPYVDWLWKGVYLGWLSAVWVVPLMFFGQWLAHRQTASLAAAGFLYAMMAGGWLLFPISLISSMSAGSRWIIFSPSVLARLLTRFGTFFTFYIVTGPLLAAITLSVFLAWRAPLAILVPVAAIAVAAGLLIYARLFGRLALMLRFTNVRKSVPPVTAVRRRGPRRPVQVRAAAYDPWHAGAAITQPSDLPPTDAPDPEARTGYNLQLPDSVSEESGRPPGHGWKVLDPPEPYEVADGPAHVDPPLGPIPKRVVEPSEYELELARTGKSPEPPDHPWLTGTFSFPFRAANHGVVIKLALGLSAFGLIIRAMLPFAPG